MAKKANPKKLKTKKVKKTPVAKKASPEAVAPVNPIDASAPVDIEILDPKPSQDDGPVDELPEADASHLLPEADKLPIPEDKAVVSYSPLQIYLMEVRKIPLLSREEEYDLAVRFWEHNDKEAAYKMVTSNLRLVVKIAMEFQRNFINVMDLIQEGNIGLMQAVQKFDPYKNVKLSSYSAWWIKAYILRYILNNWRMVKIGTTQAQRKLFYNLQKEKDRLESLGFKPTTALLAERLDVSKKDVIEMDQRLNQSDISLDMPVGDDSKAAVIDLIPDTDTQPDETVERRENVQYVRGILDEFKEDLTEKDRYIFENRMIAEDPQTLQEIGNNYGISRERVHQIESAIYKRLRKYLEDRGINES